MDSSDGLYFTLNDLSSINRLGIEIEMVPIHPKVANYAHIKGLNPLELVFGGGEEFELVFAIAPENEKLLIQESKEQNLHLIRIGSFSEKFEGIKIIEPQYEGYKLIQGGFEHFF